jgi:hypothetical protein
MSDILEIRLRPDDRGAHERLRRIVNLQQSADRTAQWRHLWTAIVALASIPLALSVWSRTPARPIPGWSVALWATALTAATTSALMEWNLRTRLRSLLAQADTTVRVVQQEP